MLNKSALGHSETMEFWDLGVRNQQADFPGHPLQKKWCSHEFTPLEQSDQHSYFWGKESSWLSSGHKSSPWKPGGTYLGTSRQPNPWRCVSQKKIRILAGKGQRCLKGKYNRLSNSGGIIFLLTLFFSNLFKNKLMYNWFTKFQVYIRVVQAYTYIYIIYPCTLDSFHDWFLQVIIAPCALQ